MPTKVAAVVAVRVEPVSTKSPSSPPPEPQATPVPETLPLVSVCRHWVEPVMPLIVRLVVEAWVKKRLVPVAVVRERTVPVALVKVRSLVKAKVSKVGEEVVFNPWVRPRVIKAEEVEMVRPLGPVTMSMEESVKPAKVVMPPPAPASASQVQLLVVVAKINFSVEVLQVGMVEKT